MHSCTALVAFCSYNLQPYVLLLFAGVYDSGRRAFMTNFVVTPGRGLGNGNPYGTLRAVYAEAKAEWKAGGNFVSAVCLCLCVLRFSTALQSPCSTPPSLHPSS